MGNGFMVSGVGVDNFPTRSPDDLKRHHLAVNQVHHFHRQLYVSSSITFSPRILIPATPARRPFAQALSRKRLIGGPVVVRIPNDGTDTSRLPPRTSEAAEAEYTF